MDNIDLSTVIGDIRLSNCIYNASGPRCTTQKELESIGESMSGAILTKSTTLEEREGNPLHRYYENEWGSINSMGLPNKGYQYYLALADSFKKHQKPYIISVGGLSLEHNLQMLRDINEVEMVDAIELNYHNY